MAEPVFVVAHLHEVAVGPAIHEYLQRIDATLTPYGGCFRVHGGQTDVLEGSWAGDLVVLQFPNRDLAHAWYTSDIYQAILPLRLNNSSGDVIVIGTVSDDHAATDILDGLVPRPTGHAGPGVTKPIHPRVTT